MFIEQLCRICHTRFIVSSPKRDELEKNKSFVDRLIEACQSSKPQDISNLLGVSYQAAVNYLNGRLPTAKILVTISRKTGCSIDWLLMGTERKYLTKNQRKQSDLLSQNIQKNVTPELIEGLNIFFEDFNSTKLHTNTASRKTVKLKPEKIRQEKEKKDREYLNLPKIED